MVEGKETDDPCEQWTGIARELEPVLKNLLISFHGEAAGFTRGDQVFMVTDTDASPEVVALDGVPIVNRIREEERALAGSPGSLEQVVREMSSSNGSVDWLAGVPVPSEEKGQGEVLLLLDDRDEGLSDREKKLLQNGARQVGVHVEKERERLRAEQRLETYEEVLSNAYQFMGTLSKEGTIQFGNRSALEFQDVELERVKGTPLWKSPWFDHSSGVRAEIKKAVEEASNGEFVQFETTTSSGEGDVVWIDFSLTPVLQKGEVTRIIAEGRNITQRVKLDRKLRNINKRLRAIEEYAPVGISLANTEGEVLTWNPQCEDIFGYSEEEATGGLPPFFPDEPEEEFFEELERVREEGTIESREVKRTTRSGDRVHVRQSIAPVFGDEGDVEQVVYIFDDVTARKKVREELQEQQRLFQKLVENIDEVFYLVSADAQDLLYLSPGVEEIWGRNAAELMKDRWKWLDGIHEEDLERVKEAALQQPEQPLDVKYRVVQPDGTVRWVHDKSYPIENEHGEVTMMGGICEDITEYREVEQNLEQSLKEKEMLLEELHHRVKNNLQIISSLISLQMHQIPDSARAAVEDIQSQVHAIASLHETLYNSEHLTETGFESYLRELTKKLKTMYSSAQTNIELDVTPLKTHVDLERAVPCGLIVNELVSNALKHAFPEGGGAITVSLSPNEGNEDTSQYELRVEDDGVGLPEEIDADQPDRFGLQLVQILVDGELDGSYSVQTGESGTTFRIQFPLGE